MSLSLSSCQKEGPSRPQPAAGVQLSIANGNDQHVAVLNYIDSSGTQYYVAAQTDGSFITTLTDSNQATQFIIEYTSSDSSRFRLQSDAGYLYKVSPLDVDGDGGQQEAIEFGIGYNSDDEPELRALDQDATLHITDDSDLHLYPEDGKKDKKKDPCPECADQVLMDQYERPW